jgi:thiol-disulfide isomerase/thioredoxin
MLDLRRLVQYLSPYCLYCKMFEPTWRELVKEVESYANPGIKFAQVNCVLDQGQSIHCFVYAVLTISTQFCAMSKK